MSFFNDWKDQLGIGSTKIYVYSASQKIGYRLVTNINQHLGMVIPKSINQKMLE